MARVSEMMPAYKTVVGSRRRCRHALRSAKNTADPRMMKAWCGLAVLGAAACALLALSERRARRTRLMFRTKVRRAGASARAAHGSAACKPITPVVSGRAAQVKKEKLAKYIRHHRAVWPEVQEGLRRHGTRHAAPTRHGERERARARARERERARERARDFNRKHCP